MGTVNYNTEKDRASEEIFIENQQLKGKLAQLERERNKTRYVCGFMAIKLQIITDERKRLQVGGVVESVLEIGDY